jgi:hypothetical protein
LDEATLDQGLHAVRVSTQLCDGDDGHFGQHAFVLVPQTKVENLHAFLCVSNIIWSLITKFACAFAAMQVTACLCEGVLCEGVTACLCEGVFLDWSGISNLEKFWIFADVTGQFVAADHKAHQPQARHG